MRSNVKSIWLDHSPGSSGSAAFEVQQNTGAPVIARLYHTLKAAWITTSRRVSVIGAQFVRFLAIPYIMATRIDWSECPRHVALVFLDHLYIFFRLGYFPDNYGELRLWEKERSEWKYFWGSGYDPYVQSLLHRSVERRDSKVLFEDKEVCYQLCLSFGLPQPRQYGALGPGDPVPARIRELFTRHGAQIVLLKPVGGCGGRGISLVERLDGNFIVRRSNDPERGVPLEGLTLESRCVIQEKVLQHRCLDAVFPHSLNTVRIATLMTPENKVIVVGAYLRFGRGQAFVDNACSGGYEVAIDLRTGRLGDQAALMSGQAAPLSSVTHSAVSGLTLPFWDELVALAGQVQTHFAPFNRFLGMDIGVSASGPVLIEINSRYDNTGIECRCGPILKNEVIRRAFLDYGIISHRLFHSAS